MIRPRLLTLKRRPTAGRSIPNTASVVLCIIGGGSNHSEYAGADEKSGRQHSVELRFLASPDISRSPDRILGSGPDAGSRHLPLGYTSAGRTSTRRHHLLWQCERERWACAGRTGHNRQSGRLRVKTRYCIWGEVRSPIGRSRRLSHREHHLILPRRCSGGPD